MNTKEKQENTLEKLTEIANEYIKSIQDGHVYWLGRFMHPDALGAYKEMMLYYIESNRTVFTSDTLYQIFGRCSTLDLMLSVEPLEFFNNFLGYFLQELTETQITINDVKVVGLLKDKTLQHLVVKSGANVSGNILEGVHVLTFEKHKDKWLLHLNRELTQIASTLSPPSDTLH